MLSSEMVVKQAVKWACPATLCKQTVLFSPPPRQLEPLPATARTEGSLLIKDCLNPVSFISPSTPCSSSLPPLFLQPHSLWVLGWRHRNGGQLFLSPSLKFSFSWYSLCFFFFFFFSPSFPPSLSWGMGVHVFFLKALPKLMSHWNNESRFERKHRKPRCVDCNGPVPR